MHAPLLPSPCAPLPVHPTIPPSLPPSPFPVTYLERRARTPLPPPSGPWSAAFSPRQSTGTPPQTATHTGGVSRSRPACAAATSLPPLPSRPCGESTGRTGAEGTEVCHRSCHGRRRRRRRRRRCRRRHRCPLQPLPSPHQLLCCCTLAGGFRVTGPTCLAAHEEKGAEGAGGGDRGTVGARPRRLKRRGGGSGVRGGGRAGWMAAGTCWGGLGGRGSRAAVATVPAGRRGGPSGGRLGVAAAAPPRACRPCQGGRGRRAWHPPHAAARHPGSEQG